MGFSKWKKHGMHKAFFSLLTQRLSLRGWLALCRLAIISAYLPACSSFLPGFHSYPSDPGPIKVKLYFTLHSPLPITHPLVNEDFRGWALGDTRCGTIGVFFFWTLLPHPHSFLLCCCFFFYSKSCFLIGWLVCYVIKVAVMFLYLGAARYVYSSWWCAEHG